MFDTDLIFLETRIEMDMSGKTTPAETIAKLQDNLLNRINLNFSNDSNYKVTSHEEKAHWKAIRQLHLPQQMTLTQY